MSVDDDRVTIEPSVNLEQISFVSVLTQPDADEKPRNLADLERFFGPVPKEDQGRLLEGVNASEFLQ